MMRKTKKQSQESTLSIIAAMLVLFTTMLDPLISSLLAVLFLIVFAWYTRTSSKK